MTGSKLLDVGVLLLTGALLGVGYNALGLEEGTDWGIPWVGVDHFGDWQEGPTVAPVEPAASAPTAVSDDPLAPPPSAQQALPEIPDVGRPVKIQLTAFKQLYDAGAVFVVDARDDWEFAEGHIAGAVSLPWNTAGSDPALLESIDTGARPVVTYCGGGTCEVSLSLAFEMLAAGHAPIAVYEGGFPEWEAAGYPVTSGETP